MLTLALLVGSTLASPFGCETSLKPYFAKEKLFMRCVKNSRVNGVGECVLSSCRSYGTCSRNAGGAKEASMATPQIALWLGIRRHMLARL